MALDLYCILLYIAISINTKIKMRIITLLLIGIFTFPVLSFADGVSIKEAKRLAKNYYYHNTKQNQRTAYENLNLRLNYIENEDDNLFYVFDVENQKGFVIISAQDFTKPILGFSDENNIDFNNLSPSLRYMLNGYSEQIKSGIKHHAKANEKTRSKWQALQVPVENRTSIVDTEGPLLLTTWNQSPFYNDLCPTNSDGEHAVVGCVAVAMAQVMKYYDFPKVGMNSKSHNDNNGSVRQDSTIDYSKETYAWGNMPKSLSGENKDLAKLMYHCGHAVSMNWEVESSGANTAWVVYSLQNLYGYNSNIHEYHRQNRDGDYNYTDEEWEQMIRDELDLLRPIVYSGFESSTGSGHAWNCDGYKYDDTEEGYLYHMNYGWGGSGNGYFTLDNLISGSTPEGEDDHFDVGHQIIVRIYPDKDYPEHCVENKVINGNNGLFGDGSGNELYQNNLDCQTLIQPECQTGKIVLNFVRYDLADGDEIYVYDGKTTDSPLIATINQDNYSDQHIASSGSMLIQFVTDGSGRAGGWDAKYTTATCSYAKKTERGGTIEDGSGICDYSPGEDCLYYIEPENETRITLRFSEFNLDTPDKDYLNVYDGETGDLLIAYKQSTPPDGDYVVNSSKVKLRFRSYSDDNVGTGWKLKYLSGEEGINDVVNFNNLIKVYPNPFNMDAFIEVSNTNSKDVKIILTDIVGKVLLEKELGRFVETRIISLSELGFSNDYKGIYLLNVQIDNQIKTYKLVSE